MTQKTQTLADGLIREWSKPVYNRLMSAPGLVPKLVAESRKFVLDAPMSAFMADLAYASLLTTGSSDAASKLLNGMRSLARLPHKSTWIEYDFPAKAKRAVSEYGATIDLTLPLSEKCGWLCLQHPTLETAFLAVHVSSHTHSEGDRHKYQYCPTIGPLAYAWRTDEGPPPWPAFAGKVRGRQGTYENVAGYLTGILTYHSDAVALTFSPFVSKDFTTKYIARSRFDSLVEFGSDLRYLWALLATINDLPTTLTDVRPDKGYILRGRYRKFCEHKVIHLHIPEKRYRRVAQQAIAISRRRAHPVRGHWRKDFRNPGSAFCDHTWSTPYGDNHASCELCGRRRTWVKEHERGDASLGHVLHDYTVERECPPSTGPDSWKSVA